MRAADYPGPVDDDSLPRLFEAWPAGGRLALAVSGGPDSLALLLLADRLRRLRDDGSDLVVVSVDHGLRPESAAEMQGVGEIAAQLGIAFRGLVWKGPHPASDIEAAARAARYELLAGAAREAGAGLVATGHHRDDQAETFLLRLARGSGVYGLGAMAARVERGGVAFIRPLLDLPRASLAATLAGAGLSGAVDPHNSDARFARARMRSLMPRLAAEGLDAPTLAATAERMRRAAAAIDHYAGRLLRDAARADPTGAVRLQRDAFLAEPEETRLRAIARILRAVGGAAYTPRLDPLAALEREMAGMAGEGGFRRTLAGVVVEARQGEFRFQREAGRSGLPQIEVIGRRDFVWDGRFRMRIGVDGDPVVVGPLGLAARRDLAICLPGGLPRAMDALPAVRREGRILAVPSLGVVPAADAGLEVEVIPLVAQRLADPARADDS